MRKLFLWNYLVGWASKILPPTSTTSKANPAHCLETERGVQQVICSSELLRDLQCATAPRRPRFCDLLRPVFLRKSPRKYSTTHTRFFFFFSIFFGAFLHCLCTLVVILILLCYIILITDHLQRAVWRVLPVAGADLG